MHREHAARLPLKIWLLITLLLGTNIVLFLRVIALERNEAAANNAPGFVDMGLPPGSPAPAFALADTNGATYELENLVNSDVLLVFTSTDCVACDRVYTELNKFQEANPDVVLLMISRGSPEENLALAETRALTFPVLQWEDSVVNAYRVQATPFFVMIEDGGLVKRAGLAGSLDDLKQLTRG
ncbi:MAG: redoxin domain-containing protein [Acidobacteriota bacterium]|nr:redoxin domain-containing protein [Acidobacteriota bacterium]